MIALSVGAIGLVAYAWRFGAVRSVPLTAVWLTAPLLGAVIAFLLGPTNLAMLGLGGSALVLALLTLVGSLVAAGRRDRPEHGPSRAEPGTRDRAARARWRSGSSLPGSESSRGGPEA